VRHDSGKGLFLRDCSRKNYNSRREKNPATGKEEANLPQEGTSISRSQKEPMLSLERGKSPKKLRPLSARPEEAAGNHDEKETGNSHWMETQNWRKSRCYLSGGGGAPFCGRG